MRRLVALFLLSAASLLLFCGCSDDEKSLAPEPAPKYLIVGTVILRPYVDFMGTIYPINGQVNEIDSVLIGDSAATIAKTGNYIEGNNYGYTFTYSNEFDFTRFHSGDRVEIRIVKGQEVATVRLTLLAMPYDSVRIVSPAEHTVMPLNTDVSIDWDPITNADWYSVTYWYDTSTIMGSDLIDRYDSSADTTYLIPGETLTTDGRLQIFVTAVTGPLPGEAGNVRSTSMTGAIYGWAVPGVRYPWELTVGSGLPLVSTVRPKPLPQLKLPTVQPRAAY